jgi:GNAT superfamily N-acetyltransferase
MLAAVIRAATAADARELVGLLNAVHPARVGTVEGFVHRLRTSPARARRQSWVAEKGGRVIGVATALLNYESSVRSWFASVTVAPAERGRGVGGALAAVALEHTGGERVVTEVHDDAAAERFAAALGFRKTFTRRHSSVDPRTVSLDPLPSGLELVPLAQLEPRAVYEVDCATVADVPLDEPMDAMRFDQWLLDYWEQPDMDLSVSAAVCSDGAPVAITYLRLDPATARGLTDYTATLPAFRGRGLARIVKQAALREAAGRGITVVLTQNDETNAPMLAVNGRLGYRPHSRCFSYLREGRSAGTASAPARAAPAP